MDTKDIFECADHREYLRSYLSTKTPTRGVRALARRAGLKSPGYLTMVVKGERRLTARSADMLAKALALKGRRRALLLAFSRLDSGKSETEKNIAREEILRLKSFRAEYRLGAKQFAFLATWYYPVVYAVLENNPGQFKAAELAARLGRGVTATQVEAAFADLEALGLVEQTADGARRAVHAALTTPPELRDLAAAKYHRNALELAEEALALPLEEREFGGLTLAVPHQLLPLVKEKMRALRRELNELSAVEGTAADIYQLNLQFFPLTNGLERKST